ncbi:hypothetical protein BRC2024_OQYPJBKP_CDS_0011 [Acinetobacter phage vB_AbaM_Highwayman]|nr:hypothetical protein [Acinetobacter phage Ab31]WMC00499.1 hypothetical protein [Acinetobacter phage Ab59]WMC00657.1 hypothetical protein [Acinetobacter phage Ab65]
MGCVMESYKIRVNNEAESKEAQELFVQLGYKLDSFFGKYEATTKWVLAFADGSMGCASEALVEALREITFPQLRDLVVLKRNDVKDANYRSKSVLDGFYFKSCDGVFYFMFEGEWVRSTTNTDEGLEPITKGSDLISGADALRALADGVKPEEIEGRFSTGIETYFLSMDGKVDVFLKYLNKKLFRLKPQTVKVELELPKPFEPKADEKYWYLKFFDGKDYDWDYFFGDKNDQYRQRFGVYRTEDEIKQVVEQLRKIKGAV